MPPKTKRQIAGLRGYRKRKREESESTQEAMVQSTRDESESATMREAGAEDERVITEIAGSAEVEINVATSSEVEEPTGKAPNQQKGV